MARKAATHGSAANTAAVISAARTINDPTAPEPDRDTATRILSDARANGPVPGDNIFIRTPTTYFSGVFVHDNGFSWGLAACKSIIETGNLTTNVPSGAWQNYEDIPDRLVHVAKHAIIDWSICGAGQ